MRWTEEEYKRHLARRSSPSSARLGAPIGSNPSGESSNGMPMRQIARPPSERATGALSDGATSTKAGSGAPSSSSQRSELEELLAQSLDARGIRYVRELHFSNLDASSTRGWRFDFGILPLELRLLVEIHGALGRGKHSRLEGQLNDLEKANAASEAGYTVLAYGGPLIRDGRAADQIARIVRARWPA